MNRVPEKPPHEAELALTGASSLSQRPDRNHNPHVHCSAPPLQQCFTRNTKEGLRHKPKSRGSHAALITSCHDTCSSKMYPNPSKDKPQHQTLTTELIRVLYERPHTETNHIYLQNQIWIVATHAGLRQDPARVQKAVLASSCSRRSA